MRGLLSSAARLFVAGTFAVGLTSSAHAQTFQGGLLALSSNSGHHERDRFAAVPEAGVSVGYRLTDHVRVSAGYNFLYVTQAARAGSLAGGVVDSRLVPQLAAHDPAGVAQPAVTVDTSLTASTGMSGLGGLSLAIPGGLSSLPGTGPLSAGNFPSTIQQPPAVKAAPAPRLFVPVASRKPLAMAFLGWEALVMCGVAAWVWARKTVAVA